MEDEAWRRLGSCESEAEEEQAWVGLSIGNSLVFGDILIVMSGDALY